MWSSNQSSETLAFGLPAGRTMQSYFTGLNGTGLGLLVLAIVLIGIVHLVLYSREKNFPQLIAIVLEIFIVVYIGAPGLTAMRGVIEATRTVTWAWLTGG